MAAETSTPPQGMNSIKEQVTVTFTQVTVTLKRKTEMSAKRERAKSLYNLIEIILI
jgi:hypothetical protein